MVIVKHASELHHGLSAYDGGLLHVKPDLRHNIFQEVAGVRNPGRWMTIEPTLNGKCVLDLTPMANEDPDGYLFRLPCKIQALKDVIEGRLRHLHNGETFATFERVNDEVIISFHRAAPTRVTISLKDLEEQVRVIEDTMNASPSTIEVQS